jgi:hypothetical protein
LKKKLGWLPRCGRIREKERVVQKKRKKNTRGVKESPLTFVPECSIELPNLGEILLFCFFNLMVV